MVPNESGVLETDVFVKLTDSIYSTVLVIRVHVKGAFHMGDSTWAKTPKLGIWYHSEGQMLSYIFRILEHCSSFWYVIAVPKSSFLA